MFVPSLDEFLKLSNKGNLIPVYKQISADLDTPVSAFLKMKQDDYAFLFESVEGQEKIARYSFLGTKPSLVFTSRLKDVSIASKYYPSRRFTTKTNPLDEIKKIMKDFQPVEVKNLPRFYGGLVGYISYDMVRFFEKLPDKNIDDLALPDSVFILTDTILIFDHLNHTVKIVSNVILPKNIRKLSREKKKRFYYEALRKIENIENDFRNSVIGNKQKRKNPVVRSTRLISNMKKIEFQKMVKKAKRYIKNGDIIQAVLSQRFKLKIGKDPFDIYRKLRSLNPSSYMFFLKLKDIILIGSSPEMLVRCEDGLVQTRPIAGTRHRGKTQKEDKKLIRQLMNDKKEKAEHIMLVDLGRNDLGRVCKNGSVKISEFMRVEKYSHVMHLVSEVRGKLDKRYDIYDCLRACFPAGTVSGSPKIRAMEIIDELENVRRGPYAGCVGYFSFSHNMDTCITIRTIIINDNCGYVQAGAGIVADSIPQREYYESVNKARALVEAATID